MARDTARFLQLMNEMNTRIAAREGLTPVSATFIGDPVRVQKETERRKNSNGPLRARPRPRSRPIIARHVFGTPFMGTPNLGD
jgi:hypothetical protein